MYLHLIITSLLLSTIRGQDMLHFSRDETSLDRCIESNLIKLGEKNARVIKTIADFLSKKYAGNTLETRLISSEVKSLISSIQDDEESQSSNNFWIYTNLETATESALKDCSDEHSRGGNQLSIDYFPDEDRVYGTILDYILVTWPKPLLEMVQSEDGLTLLRKYVDDVLKVLKRIFNNGNSLSLRLMVRVYWLRRASLFYNGRDTETPYLQRHTYTAEDGLAVSGNISSFYYRRSQSFAYRNPSALPEEITRVASIQAIPGPSQDRNHNRLDNRGKTTSLSRVEYYIEHQIIQFYRIIFLILELRNTNTCFEESNMNNCMISEELLAMLEDDVSYQLYIERRSCVEMEIDSVNARESALRRRLANSIFTDEEDLIEVMLLRMNRVKGSTTMTSTTTTTTSTTTTTTSTTPKSQQGPSRKNHWSRYYGTRDFKECTNFNRHQRRWRQQRRLQQSRSWKHRNVKNNCEYDQGEVDTNAMVQLNLSAGESVFLMEIVEDLVSQTGPFFILDYRCEVMSNKMEMNFHKF